jgi:hypothetical protein
VEVGQISLLELRDRLRLARLVADGRYQGHVMSLTEPDEPGI